MRGCEHRLLPRNRTHVTSCIACGPATRHCGPQSIGYQCLNAGGHRLLTGSRAQAIPSAQAPDTQCLRGSEHRLRTRNRAQTVTSTGCDPARFPCGPQHINPKQQSSLKPRGTPFIIILIPDFSVYCFYLLFELFATACYLFGSQFNLGNKTFTTLPPILDKNTKKSYLFRIRII